MPSEKAQTKFIYFNIVDTILKGLKWAGIKQKIGGLHEVRTLESVWSGESC